MLQQDNQYPPSIAEPLQEAAKCSKTNSELPHSEHYGKEGEQSNMQSAMCVVWVQTLAYLNNSSSEERQTSSNKDFACDASYSRSNSTKSPASGAGKVSEPRLKLQVERMRDIVMRLDRCVSAAGVVEVPVFFCLSSSCKRETEVGGP